MSLKATWKISNCSPASDGGGLHTGYCSKSPTGRGRTTPEQSPNHEKGTLLLQVSKAPPGIREVPETPPVGVAERHLESPALHGSCSKKRRRSQSRRRDSRPTVPFPLQEHEGRLQALRTLYEEAREHRLASEMTALRGLQISHPDMGAEELQCLNNQVLLMIAEYHLTSAS